MTEYQNYIYRNTYSKLWTAESREFDDLKATCSEPEDSLKRIQVLILERLASRVMTDTLTNNLEITIKSTVMSEQEAREELAKKSYFSDGSTT